MCGGSPDCKSRFFFCISSAKISNIYMGAFPRASFHPDPFKLFGGPYPDRAAPLPIPTKVAPFRRPQPYYFSTLRPPPRI